MHLLNRLTVINFKGFRKKTVFNFSDGSYFCGANNSGKTTVLNALHFFFDESIFTDESFINRSSFLSKRKDSNKAQLEIEFNLECLTTRIAKQQLIKRYGKVLTVSKRIAVATDTKTLSLQYAVNGSVFKTDLPNDVLRLIRSVKITYLHPQEGKELLHNAQSKLRQRLLASWGLGTSIPQSVRQLQNAWVDLRRKASDYLSRSLTDDVQAIWPDSQILVSLPRDIREIIAVSDIDFLSDGGPAINLTSQGTGAQSIILYLIHFLLDSDRSLHRGEYHPVWLLEEPESFLHANLVAQLAAELNSEKWLKNIQMVVSTHSPILLAGTRVAGEKVIWGILDNYAVRKNKAVTLFDVDEIEAVGELMGDLNFQLYFLAAQKTPLVFIEDGKELTKEKYADAGIPVTRGLNGVPEIAKYLDVYTRGPSLLSSSIYFIVDADKGRSGLSRFYDEQAVVEDVNGFKKFLVKDAKSIFLVLLPEGQAAEDLFDEFDNHLEECVVKIWNTTTWQKHETIPTDLYRTYGRVRAVTVSSMSEAKAAIKNTDDVKDKFWDCVAKYGYSLRTRAANSLKQMIGT